MLTVNEPTGLTAVPPADSGEAAGMINTSEQLGGAIGIAALTALELGINFHVLADAFEATFAASAGIALLGALVCLFLVRRGDRVVTGPVFSRRSRWVFSAQGRSSAVTMRPDSSL